jgi:hypothetical protein
MKERTAKALADAFEPRLIEKKGKLNLVCESEDESVLLAHELKKRGWNAEPDACLIGEQDNKGGIKGFRGAYSVMVQGKQGEKAAPVRGKARKKR